MLRTSPTHGRRRSGRPGTRRDIGTGIREAGFALIEMVVALAIIGMIIGLVLPRVSRDPGPAALRAKAYEIAGLLRQDRNAALMRRQDVVSRIDLPARTMVSGAFGNAVRIPDSVTVDLVQSDKEALAGGGGFRFFPDGRSSGGALTLSRGPVGYRVSVNWLTAGVDVAPVAAVASR